MIIVNDVDSFASAIESGTDGIRESGRQVSLHNPALIPSHQSRLAACIACPGFQSAMLLLLVSLFTLSLAQRPSNTSTCDFYAQSLYASDTSEAQYDLVQHIVALAFGGAPPNNATFASDLTGILLPGSFQDLLVKLQPWFNGSIDSTNLNNQPVGIDWLDGVGLDPLHAYLNGTTSSVVLANTTNQ